MSATLLRCNGKRLWETLEASGEIGRVGERGLMRLALTDEDRAMRDLFIKWARDAGCEIAIDEVGNIFARRAGLDSGLLPVAIGSHLDSTICGGRYDGILGVLAGLEIVRALNDQGQKTRRGIEIVCWTDEEGTRFSRSMMGSSALAGVYEVSSVLAAADKNGKTFGSELQRIGYAGKLPAGQRKFDSYFELHIEQGPILDASEKNVGIVHGSYEVRGRRFLFRGETAHVGPTPMDMRHNALAAAGHAIAAIDDIGWRYHDSGGKTTVARIECHPNLYGIIADRVEIGVDFRHPEGARVAEMANEIDQAVLAAAKRAQVACETLDQWTFGGFDFSSELVSLLRSTAAEMGVPYLDMRSQAGHDAYSIAKVAPTVMIFTPCKNGTTHNFNEDAELERTMPGVDLLLNAVVKRADQ